MTAKAALAQHRAAKNGNKTAKNNVKNFHGSLTTVVRAQNDTTKTANITDTIFDRTLVQPVALYGYTAGRWAFWSQALAVVCLFSADSNAAELSCQRDLFM